jgi:Homing endonuclease associated repeat
MASVAEMHPLPTDPRHVEARRMRADGMLLREIAERFGVSTSTALRWTDDDYRERQLAKSRAVKKRYAGQCRECGAETNGSNGPGSAADVCGRCAPAVYTVWTRLEIVRAVQRFAMRYGRPPTSVDFCPTRAHAAGHRWRAERFYRDGDYPHVHSVQARFGSWSEAIRAAGFRPNRPGHYPRAGRAGDHLAAEGAA